VPRQPEYGWMTEPSVDAWHEQFLRQARWTQGMRNQLYRRAGLLQAERVLDVGCGTGVITRELARRTRGEVIGLDVDPEMLKAAQYLPSGDAPVGQGESVPRYERGDAQDLPYPDRHFDIVTCHFLLLWVSDPRRTVREMARVTASRGALLFCAEPDYGGRLDWPELPVRQWQIDGLRRQGADPLIGRQLRQLLVGAGLRAEVGIHPSVWNAEALGEQFEAEWAWLRRDVGEAVDEAAFERAMAQAKTAIDAGTRLVYMPVFYGLGRKA
jgi:ubiquinone/menaquinone biosynthesis C-methylase UbiE